MIVHFCHKEVVISACIECTSSSIVAGRCSKRRVWLNSKQWHNPVKLFSITVSFTQDKAAAMISLAVWHMNNNDMSVGIPMISVVFHKKIEIIQLPVLNKKSTLYVWNKSPLSTSSVQIIYCITAYKDRSKDGLYVLSIIKSLLRSIL